MVLPFIAAGLPGAASMLPWGTIANNAMGRPFDVWTAQVQAENAARTRWPTQSGNSAFLNTLPTPDAIFSSYRAGLITPITAIQGLVYQGIMPPDDVWAKARELARSEPDPRAQAEQTAIIEYLARRNRVPSRSKTFYAGMWQSASYMGMSRPDPGTVAQLYEQGRISDDDIGTMRHGLDASWSRYSIASRGQYQSPTYQDVRSHWAMGRIDDAGYTRWSQRAGWTDTPARRLSESISTLPTPTEVWLAHWRGAIPAARLRAYGMGLGYVNDEDWRAVSEAALQLPGPSDLVRFAVREVWDEETVRRLGYDEEFPAPFNAWMRYWGQDWGRELALPDGTRIPNVPWPKAYWRAHWQTMSPEQSYRAFQLLRPDRIQRYREISPDVTPFTAADLAANLKIADYPKPVRAWLQAIAYTPLDLRAVRALFQAGLRDRAWLIAQMRDRGLVTEDATAFADLEDYRKTQKDRAAVEAIERSLVRGTFRSVIEAYQEGLTTAEAARTGLRDLGLSARAVDRALALTDARFRFETTRTALQQIRKAYLDGTLAATEIPGYLTALGIDRSAHATYLRRWNLQRTLARRGLSTSRVLSLVAQGALAPTLAAGRLANLGWTAADIQVQIGVALAKLAQAQARALVAGERQAKGLQREKLAALRQADAAVRRLRAELRQQAPLSTLRSWYCRGIRKEAWLSARMRLLGFEPTLIDSYLSQWAIECEKQAAQTAGQPSMPERLVRRQTSLTTLKRWWQNGVVTDLWAQRRLAALGFTPESIVLYRREWADTLGRKPGPAPEGSSIGTPPVPTEQTRPRVIEQAPRTLTQTPRTSEPGTR